MKGISDKTIQRLALYRRLLRYELLKGREYVFSYELAEIADISPAQVRRDLMVLEQIGNPNKGYKVAILINEISTVLGGAKHTPVALVGVGNLGRAVLSYFSGKRPDLPIVCTFDSDPDKAGRVISGTPCYSIKELKTKLKQHKVKVVILAIPHSEVESMLDVILAAGIKGFVNFTHIPLRVPEGVYVENLDISTSIEKVAYFVNEKGAES